MPVFKFESVLIHRRYLEEIKQKDYSDARQAVIEIRERLKRLRNNEKQSAMDLQRRIQKKSTISEHLLYVHYLEQIRIDIRKILKEIRRFEKVADQKHAELMEAVKNRKILERLKEKQALEFHREMKRNELKLLGEIAINRYNRTNDMV